MKGLNTEAYELKDYLNKRPDSFVGECKSVFL